MFEIKKISEGIDFDNLSCYYTSKNAFKYFVCSKGPILIYNDVLQKEEKIPEEFRSELNETLKGNPNCKSNFQKITIENIKRLYNEGRGSS